MAETIRSHQRLTLTLQVSLEFMKSQQYLTQASVSEYLIKMQTLSEVVQHLRRNTELLLHERNQFTNDKLIVLLQKDNYEGLQREFKDYQKGLKLKSFIWLLERSIDYNQENKYDLVLGLLNMFRQIDQSGDMRVTWDQFIEFGVHLSAMRFRQELGQISRPSSIQIINKAYSEDSMKFERSSVEDLNRHSYSLSCLNFSDHKLYCLEEKATDLLIYQLKLGSPIGRLKAECQIMAFALNSVQIAVLTSDRKMSVYRLDNHKKIFEIKCYTLMTGVWWIEQGYWVTASTDFKLRIIFTGQSKFLHILSGHSKIVTRVIILDHPHCLCSSSMDGLILLWDIHNFTKLAELYDTKDRFNGVIGVQYCDNWGHFLISWNFSTKIKIWCPQISLTQGLMNEISGHNYRVVACKFTVPSPYLISVDEKENFKIWDIRTLDCVQVIISYYEALITCMSYDPYSQRIYYAGKTIKALNHPKAQKQLKRDKVVLPLKNCLVSVKNREIYMTSSTDLRVIDIKTGQIKSVFIEKQEGKIIQISCMCLTKNQFKMMLGTQEGTLIELNLQSVQVTSRFKLPLIQEKRLDASNQVLALYFLHDNSYNKSIFAGTRLSLVYLINNSKNEMKVMRIFAGGHNCSPILSLFADSRLGIICSGSQNGIFSLWDFNSYRIQSALDFSKLEPNQPGIVSSVVCPGKRGICIGLRAGYIAVVQISQNLSKLNLICLVQLCDFGGIVNISLVSKVSKNADKISLKRRFQGQFQTVQTRQTGEYGLMVGRSNGNFELLGLAGILQQIPDSKDKVVKLNRAQKKDIQFCNNLSSKFSPFKPKINYHSAQSLLYSFHEAHQQGMTDLYYDPISNSILTLSLTRTLKVWDSSCILRCNLDCNSQRVKMWDFPFDWINSLLNDISQSINLVQLLQNKKISQRKKQQIKAGFLKRKFGLSNALFISQPELPQMPVLRPFKLKQLQQEIEEQPQHYYSMNFAFKSRHMKDFKLYLQSQYNKPQPLPPQILEFTKKFDNLTKSAKQKKVSMEDTAVVKEKHSNRLPTMKVHQGMMKTMSMFGSFRKKKNS